MSFTGKATYSSGSSLPELAEDVSDLIGIVSRLSGRLGLGSGWRQAGLRKSQHASQQEHSNPCRSDNP